MSCQKVYDTGLLYHHYANTAYPLTPGSFMAHKVKGNEAVRSLLESEWAKADELCLYVHVPFCKARCKFCEYTVLEAATDEMQDSYVDLLLREIAMYAPLVQGKTVVGFDVGGGTPLFISESNLSRIVERVRSHFNILPDVEWSIETTPLIAAREPEKIRAAYALGFSRISMGVQTVSPRLLEDLGREGEPQFYELAMKNLREAGFDHINLDLMYGFLHQTDIDLDATLRCAIALESDFITLYRNRYKGTRIESEAGGVSLYKAMRQYRLAYDRLSEAGFEANIGKNTFSRIQDNPGTSDYLTHRVVEGTPYIGLGLGAQSFGPDYLAYNYGAASKRLDAYEKAIEAGIFPVQDAYALPRDESIAKMVSVAFYFGYIDLEKFEHRFGIAFGKQFPDEVAFVEKHGLMERADGRLMLTPRGADYVNGVIPLFYSPASKEELVRLYEGQRHEPGADEKVFLSAYRIDDYDRPSVATDVVAMTLRAEKTDNYRAPERRVLSVLLIQRGEHPFMNAWALPGGFLRRGETVEHCAQRELFEEAGLSVRALVPLGCFSGPGRDPRGWIISNAFLSIISKEENALRSGDDAIAARWFDLEHSLDDNRLRLTLSSDEVVIRHTLRVVRGDFGQVRFEPEPKPDGTPALAFDHALILATSLARLGSDSALPELAFAFTPPVFTIAELLAVHEMILGSELPLPNFRRKIAPYLEETGVFVKGCGHRPARLFRRRPTAIASPYNP